MNAIQLVEKLAALTELVPPVGEAEAIFASIQRNELGEATAAEIHRRAAAWSIAVAEYGESIGNIQSVVSKLDSLPSFPFADIGGV